MAGDPWGITGPDFLGFYIGALITATIVSVIVRRRFWNVPVPPPRAPVSMDELAFLTGGVNLMIDTAIARLVESGALRVQRDGTVQATGAPGQTDLDRDIIQYVRRTPATAGTLRRELREHQAADRAKASLKERRLIHEETGRQTFLVLLPLLVVLGAGVLRYANGLEEDRATGFLLALLIITLVVVVSRWSVPTKYTRTKPGARLIKRVRQLGPAESSRLLPVAALTGAAGLVVIGGLQAFPDSDIAVALGPSAAPGSAGSTSSCGSSGSSCGGGGCGGGGCGG